MKKTILSVISLFLVTATLLCSCATFRDPDDAITLLTTKDQTVATTTRTPSTTSPNVPTLPTTDPSSYDEAENTRFEEFLDDLFMNEVVSSTLTLHYTILDKAKYGLDDLEPSWGRLSEDKYPADKIIETFDGFDIAKLSSENALDYRILYAYVSKNIEMSDEKFDYLGSYFDLSSGYHSAITTNLSEYEFYREKDITDFIALIEQLPDLFDSILEYEEERVEKGYGMTDEVLDEVISQCIEIAEPDGELYLIDVVKEKLDKVDFLDKAKRKEYVDKVRIAVNESMIPTYKKVVDTLSGFKGKAKNEFGLCYYENGKEYYQLLAQDASSTTLSCEQMIAALDADFEALYGELMGLYSDAEFVNGLDKDGYAIDMTDPEQILEFLREKIKTDFPAISGEDYEIDYLSKEMESVMSSAVAYYMTPQIDNFLHGKMKINGATLSADEAFSTLAHEGFPGHMYQTVYYWSNEPASLRKMLNFLGYSEGWAVYAGNYAYSLYGFDDYTDSLAQKIIRYYVISERISWNVECRLDLGIHYEGWTVGQVKQYLDERGLNSSNVEEIYTQLLGMPATFLAYYVGYLELERLLDWAKTTLGDKFSAVEFHRAVLDVGPCTMDFVESAVINYVNSKK